jgi:hypothetical protein
MSYIGQGLGQGQAERFVFTAAGGETNVTLDDSGRGIAYTVGQVDVYLNGVKLVNGTDFTATSGSSITGLSALVASDIVEIVALDAFSPADTVSASNGGTFSGNVTFADGIVVDNDGATVATFDRATSDGTIVEFQKDGTTVGSIGTVAGDLYFGTDNSTLRSTGVALIPGESDGTTNDNAVDLGVSGSRFKDLYLSGGVYLGGTGAANYLDDYEEGTWTPVFYNDGNVGGTYTTQFGKYIKIGNKITAWFTLKNTTMASTDLLRLGGLPFSVSSSLNSMYYVPVIMEGKEQIGLEVYQGTSNQVFRDIVANNYMTITGGANKSFSGVYEYIAA